MSSIDLRDILGLKDSEDKNERGEYWKWKNALEGSGYDFEETVENEPFFIADYNFEDYAQELAEDIGAIGRDNQWPVTCIDWDRAASELQYDYASVEVD